MRSLDNRIDVQVADWRNCGRDRAVECFLSQVRVSLIELLHLPKRPPTQITGPGVAEVGVENSGESSAGVELRGNLACNPLVLYKTMLTSQFDGIFVVAHRFKIMALDARDFSGNQRRAITEVFRGKLRPRHRFAVCAPPRRLDRVSAAQESPHHDAMPAKAHRRSENRLLGKTL